VKLVIDTARPEESHHRPKNDWEESTMSKCPGDAEPEKEERR